MVIKIADDGSFVDEPRNEHLNRTSIRFERQAKRRRIRNTLMLVGVVALMGAVAATIVMVLTMNSGGLSAPKLVGMKFTDAKKQVESLGLFVQIDSMQDSSGNCSKLKVELQDPKAGTSMEKDDTIMVRLKGLHESPEFTGRTSNNSALATSPDAGSDAPGATETQPAAPAQQQPASTGVVICLDPGHSGHDGNEIDSATGLNVGDNGAAPASCRTCGTWRRRPSPPWSRRASP